MKTTLVLELPIGGAGCNSIRICSNGVAVRIDISAMEGSGVLTFDDVYAFRFRDEMHSRGFCKESYDTVVEILESPWCRELLEIEPERILRSAEGCRHFALFLSNHGYIEVLGRNVKYVQELEN